MRLYVKRAFLCIFGLFALTGVLIIQSIASYQTLRQDDYKIFVSKDAFATHPKAKVLIMDGSFVQSGVILQHHELHQTPVGRRDHDFAADSKSGNEKKKTNSLVNINIYDAAEGKFRAAKRIKNKKLLALVNFLPNDTNLVENFCSNAITLEDLWMTRFGNGMAKNDDWDKFYAQIGTCDLYRPNSKIVVDLLKTISKAPIKHIANLDSGTQVKFIVTFENGKRALFKPMRFSRSFETHPDQFYFTDFERHNAEIASFHLDRLLGFRRAVPTVGRVVNMTSEFLAKAEKSLAKTFFYSPVKNLCFVGKCDYYCDTTHAICGKPDMVEGSFQVSLPDDEDVPRDHARSPYKRTYSKRTPQALWQKDSNYCNWKVKYTPPYSNGRALLDLVDLYILDFLMGNQDRHHYEQITVFDNPVYFLHLDNGRGFGKTMEDDLDILAPLVQCCVIRPSTLKTLLNFYFGPVSLGEALAESLSEDPVDPVLTHGHLRAVDRRLETVLRVVHRCIVEKANGVSSKVLVNTFYNAEAPAEIEEEEEDDD